ncbi:hypothetical protein CI109_104893 [Kwoniella shandongensis]|uniref:Uncharacterized protein n=1 Tax=Kwoniella shandongensis TaxID=1734106 RepID=A0A5M6BSE4_9TREE|nr:uncharacterized protein CI109_006612 [Kwoniella shandongensis]KAA5525061.1 hypothetical protein CI109_006612 [Kwoniella shandongensis]
MDPLLLAHPPTTYSKMTGDDEEEAAFDSYCIVCDRLIVPPKEVDSPEGTKTVKKKVGGGTIRVKNADGTTTTRTANGQKVTRPALKRNPNSAARLAAANVVSKMQPLTRSKTSNGTPPTAACDDGAKMDELSPQSQKVVTPKKPAQPLFRSAIYCSKSCMDADAGRSSDAYKDLARTLSYEFSSGFPHSLDNIITTGLPVTDQVKSPYGPPSPLCVSGSDTESSAASNIGAHDEVACSAPKIMDYFRMSKEGPDQAWHDLQRQRRSSMQPAVRRPSALASTDSLSSLWQQDADSSFGRSVSGSGKMRAMTPLHAPEREVYGAGVRTVSGSSDHAAPIPTRPLHRSNLSHTSLASSPGSVHGVPIPELGSTPNHTLGLLQSYANAFPMRSPSGTSSSFSQRGFVFPGSTAMSPAPSENRRGSMSRPVSGTIKARKSETTWDSLGREAVEMQNQRSHLRRVGSEITPPAAPARPESRGRASFGMPDNTPKQSLEREAGGWKIKYFAPGSVDRHSTLRSQSRSSADSNSSATSFNHESHPQGMLIPRSSGMQSSPSNGTANSHTPQSRGHMPPPSTVPSRQLATSALPDISGLRLEAGGCAVQHARSLTPHSIPRSGFDWKESEKKGMKTYEIPDAPKFKLDRNKSGLFYFQ